MSLATASKLGPYEIVGVIGAGGMGEVYRARDPRLGRDVAIKVLPSSFSADPDRLRRFEQEARAAAALNHPNILAVHDIGTHAGAPYLVSELLEGETLRERLAQPFLASSASVPSASGPSASAGTALSTIHTGLPVRKAVEYAVQMAHGLAAAHEKNLVHRDLKPENVFVTTDGRVKILDFGLAKLTQVDSALYATSLPTTPALNTQPGMILGTMGYMAPEQVRGLPVDHRADIFAFGVILYEMLAGRRAFQGATAADTITAILKEDPPDLPVADRHMPPALERIVDRCLEKAPAARFQTATDLAFALESLSSHSDRRETEAAAPPTRRSRERMAWLAAVVSSIALIGTGAVAVRHFREAPIAAHPVRFVIPPPVNTLLVVASPLEISPDGQQVVFGAVSRGVPMLWVRPLAALTPRELPGTERASYPFWSPDSRSIGFFEGGKLMKIQLSGGPPVTLCDAALGRGGAWNDDNTIIFAPSTTAALQKVSSAGGTPAPATSLNKGETGHRWPWFLPDQQHFVYVAASGGIGQPFGTLWVGSLASSETTSLGPSDSNGVYDSGHLLFLRNGSLLAEPFDPVRRRPTGEAFPIAERIFGMTNTLKGPFSVSASGVLGYRRGAVPTSQLTWFDRAGKPLGPVGDPGTYINLALSPDERRVAVSQIGASPGNIDIWMIDLARAAAPSRFTFDPAAEFDPAWSPDGLQVVFSSTRTGSFVLYRHASSGSGQDELLLKSADYGTGPDWSRDGRFIAYSANGDVWVLPASDLSGSTRSTSSGLTRSTGSGPAVGHVDPSKAEDRKPFAFLKSPYGESDPAFSPDVRWMAYTSNESGQSQVYVQAFPDGGAKYPISRGGGMEPRWRGDGRELFFLAPDGTMMAAGIDTAKDFQATVPHALFPTGITSTQNNHPYVVTNDGKRFLVPVSDPSAAAQMTVVLNWLSGVQK